MIFVKRAPVLIAGAFLLLLIVFFLTPATEAGKTKAEIKPSLAFELFSEGNWIDCRRECSRSLLLNPNQELEALYKAISGIRMGRNEFKALRNLYNNPATSASTVAMAHYETGRAYWSNGKHKQAFKHLSEAFEKSTSNEVFLHSGCSLALLLQSHPKLRDLKPELLTQLNTSAVLWDYKLVAECQISKKDASKAWTGKPAEWLILLYQKQISPGIGQRCSIYPSCSRYAVQALQKYGLFGLSLYADRCVREPDIIMTKNSFRLEGKTFYSDELIDHTWWFEND